LSLFNFSLVSKQRSKLNEPRAEYAPERAEPTSQSQPPEIDLSQLEYNLKLTPEERLIEHQRALELVLSLEAAGRKLRVESE